MTSVIGAVAMAWHCLWLAGVADALPAVGKLFELQPA